MTAFIFNAREVEPDQGRVGAIPKGWYPSIVESTELKATGNGSGAAISVMIGVVDGPYKGSKIFHNFNVRNDSEKAVEIGLKQLSSLCHAINMLDMTDTDQLKGRPFMLRVKATPAVMDENNPNVVKYEEKNEVTAFRSATDQAAIAAYKTQGQPAAPALAKPVAAPVQQQQAWTPPAGQTAALAQVAQAAPGQGAWGQPAQPAAAPVQQVAQAAPAWGAQPAQQPVQQAAPVQQVQQAAPAEAAPAWAAAQPWGDPNAGAPAGQPAQAAAAPALTAEQQAAHAAANAAPVPWGAPA